MKKSITIILLFCICFIACKKEEADNPNINHRVVNLELKVSSYNAASASKIDINDDGVHDFQLGLELNKASEDKYYYYIGLDYESDTRNEFLTQIINSDEFIKPLQNDDLISGSSSIWYYYSEVLIVDKDPGKPETKYGFSGNGDMLIGVRFLIGTELHYGWMKINVSSDFKTVIVKEVAYNIVPNVEIKAGEK